MHRTEKDGSPVYITPEEALEEAGFARANYLQNFECQVMGGSDLPFLSWDLITKSMTAPHFDVDSQAWSPETFRRMERTETATLYLGWDFARTTDLSVVSVLAENQGSFQHVARLEMQGIDSRTQRNEVARFIRAFGRRIDRVTTDATGSGTGPTDELINDFGSLILPINFGSTVPLDPHMVTVGEKRASMYISEKMALDMQRMMEDGKFLLPYDETLRDDLRKPTRVIKGGRVLVAAARDASGHADRFHSLSLAIHGYFAGSLGGWDMADLQAVEVGEPEFDGFFSRW
jgi:phage FluMu gp28-like protein